MEKEKKPLRRIYLARHPDKGKEAYGVFTEKGLRQIGEFAETVSSAALSAGGGCRIDIYFSNRDRSRIMATLLSEKIREAVQGSKAPIEITAQEDARIRQVKYSDEFIRLDREYYPKGQQEKLFEPWVKTKDCFPGSEKPEECFGRIKSFYEEKLSGTESGSGKSGIAIAISHSYVLDAFFYSITGLVRVIRPGEYALFENDSMLYAGEKYENVREKISQGFPA